MMRETRSERLSCVLDSNLAVPEKVVPTSDETVNQQRAAADLPGRLFLLRASLLSPLMLPTSLEFPSKSKSVSKGAG